MPVFVHDDGRSLVPTAYRAWNVLLDKNVELAEGITGALAEQVTVGIAGGCGELAKGQWEELMRTRQGSLVTQRENGAAGFQARLRLIDRIGLPEVRATRRVKLAEEERIWRERLDETAMVAASLVPGVLLGIEGDGFHAA